MSRQLPASRRCSADEPVRWRRAPAADALADRAAPREGQAEASEEARAFEMAAEALAEPSPGLGATVTDGQAFRDAVDTFAVAGKDETSKSETEKRDRLRDRRRYRLERARSRGQRPPAALPAARSPMPVAALQAAESPMPVAALGWAVPTAVIESPAPAAALDAALDGDAGAAGEQAPVEGIDARAMVGATDGIAIQSILVAVGTVLAIGGALLLLLTWFLRRSADPLLR